MIKIEHQISNGHRKWILGQTIC